MYYLHDEPGAMRFRIVGRMSPEESRDLESCYRTAESVRAGRAMVLDARRLEEVDAATQELLGRLEAAGVVFVGRDNTGKRKAVSGRRTALQTFTLRGATRFLLAALSPARRML